MYPRAIHINDPRRVYSKVSPRLWQVGLLPRGEENHTKKVCLGLQVAILCVVLVWTGGDGKEEMVSIRMHLFFLSFFLAFLPVQFLNLAATDDAIKSGGKAQSIK